MAASVVKQNGRQSLVMLQGDLTAVVVPDLQADLKELLNKGARKLVFDPTNTAMLDSSGMGLLIQPPKVSLSVVGRFAWPMSAPTSSVCSGACG